ncbi:MAG: hypothetical protein K8H88_06705, partial [Sandaracinaceae bacterium]|nr:hypothetical protein [Sandaracinaceae bacterium]
MRMPIKLTIATLGLVLSGCGSQSTQPARPPILHVLAPRDLRTNSQEPPRVGWIGPVDDREAGVYNVPWEEVLTALRDASHVVEWPSRAAVTGHWETVPAEPGRTPTLRFIHEGPPSAGWEAIYVERSRLPAAFHDPLLRDPIVRFSPRSRPIVVRVGATRIAESDDGATTGYPPVRAGNDMVGPLFSEPVGSLATIHSMVHLENESGAPIPGCEPHAPIVPYDVPGDSVLFQCPPFTEGQSLRVRIDGRLASPSGVSVASAYGQPEGTEIVLDVTLRGDDTQRSADPLALER